MYSRSQLSIRHFSYYGLPKYSRIKTISKLLNVTAKKVAEHIGIHQKGKGRYLCCYDHEWYQFQSANDIIIPFHIAQKYASYHKKKFHYLDFYNLPSACSSDNDKENIQRVPVIALLGHFNHGKTTLLDLFAKSNYVSKESHGITQEIRTKYVQLTNGEGKEYGVTLVDTPGQEIFYPLGAGVADMGLLLVAADEGIGNQTQESIGTLEDLRIPVIVCLNKIDHPTVLPHQQDRIEEMTKLIREYLILEDAPIVPISALLGTNFQQLQKEIFRMILSLPKPSKTLDISQKDLPVSVVKKMLPHYVGLGTVLNIWTNPNEGQMIHLIVRDGEILPGMWFSAGGWAGSVVVVSSDAPGGTPCTRGLGVKIRISAKVTKEPRPIGDSIYFFQDRENAFQLADFRSMDLTLEDHLIPRELWNEYGIPSILKQKRKSGKNEDFRDLEAVDEDDDFVSQETSEQIEDVEEDITTVADHGNRKKIIYKGKEYIEDLDDDDKESVILKANSDLALCTFMDSIDEIQEWLEGNTVEPHSPNRDRAPLEILSEKTNYQDIKLREVVRGGIGNVNIGDVLMASRANGPILAYDVRANPDALKLAQEKGVKILYFNKMQDVVDILRGSPYENFTDNMSPPSILK